MKVIVNISSVINEVTAYLGQSVGMGYRLLAPRETSKEQNGEEEVVLRSHKHSMRCIWQSLQHLNAPGYEWKCVNVWIKGSFAVMIELIGGSMMGVVLCLPPVSTEALQRHGKITINAHPQCLKQNQFGWSPTHVLTRQTLPINSPMRSFVRLLRKT